MGNTPSGEENNTTNAKTISTQHTNMNSNLPKTGSQTSDVNKNTAPAPGWSLHSSQQTPGNNQKNESNTAFSAAPNQSRLYPQPPTFDKIFDPSAAPQYPTAPESSTLISQHFNNPAEYSTSRQTNMQPQHYDLHQSFMQQEKYGTQQFYAQIPAQKQSVLYPQPPVFSDNSLNPNSPLMPFNSSPIEPNSNNWVRATQKSLPPNAFRAGFDTDSTELVICRAAHAGNIIPGKMVPTHKCAYIAYDGKEFPKECFEVLVGDRYRWVLSHGGQIPRNAVEGGHCSNGEKLYIGRARFKNSLTPGKIHPSHMCLYVPYDGQEMSFTEYEILVHLD